MLQFPAYMKVTPSSFLLPSQWPQPQQEELLLAMEETDFEEKVALIKSPNPPFSAGAANSDFCSSSLLLVDAHLGFPLPVALGFFWFLID